MSDVGEVLVDALKRCTQCGCEKPLDDFHKDSSSKDGLSIYCRPCKREIRIAYRLRNPDHHRALERARAARERANNPERKREIQRQSRAKNPERAREINRAWYRNNVDKVAQADRLRKYGITQDGYEAMLMAQECRCAICGVAEPGVRNWCVDHCHITGVVRGLLCCLCNTALGKFKDSPAILRAAATYLERFE